MAVYYALGDALVTEEELIEKRALGRMAEFSKALRKKSADATLEFSTGRLTADNLLSSVVLPSGDTVPFEEVGPGKPLSVEIRHIYTGKFPKKGVFDATKDMLVTSAMKSLATFNAAPRAVNFMRKDVRAHYNLSNPAATEKGTPLIHYTPALTERNTVLTLEIGFDEFPDEIFDIVGGALTQAAGIPLFVAGSTHLLAAGAITRLLGKLGSRVFDRAPVFNATEPLTFLRPGDRPPQADFRLITEENADLTLLQEFRAGPEGLIDGNGKRYDGPLPYIVISLDGRVHDEYREFAPTAASAALLERFYSIRDGQEQTLGPLLDALKLYNDWSFRKKADALARDLEKLDSKSPEYKKKKAEHDALVANILSDLLRPKN
ncbi:MAG: hypothetical protein GXP47_11745 [Acidobacteria bacterium]|nr:hypothetical protein [Acidobacteriota bacterium]